jgi:hypothetical protein
MHAFENLLRKIVTRSQLLLPREILSTDSGLEPDDLSPNPKAHNGDNQVLQIVRETCLLQMMERLWQRLLDHSISPCETRSSSILFSPNTSGYVQKPGVK